MHDQNQMDDIDLQQYSLESDAKIKLYAHLEQSAEDIKFGRVQPMDQALDDIIREVENL